MSMLFLMRVRGDWESGREVVRGRRIGRKKRGRRGERYIVLRCLLIGVFFLLLSWLASTRRQHNRRKTRKMREREEHKKIGVCSDDIPLNRISRNTARRSPKNSLRVSVSSLGDTHTKVHSVADAETEFACSQPWRPGIVETVRDRVAWQGSQ